MASRDLEEDVYEFLQGIQLEQFFDKVHHVLHLTRLAHFDHVAEGDLTDISMSKPEQRRLFDALKKHKKDKKRSGRTRFSFRKSKKKESSPSVSSNSPPSSHVQGKSCLINETSLKLREEIGDGAFGVVRKGEWTTTTGSKVLVAVKCLKYSNGEAFVNEQTNFMREASAMSDLDHPNVIHLYGVVLTTPLQLVMEYASLGSLYDRLKQEPQKFFIAQLCDFVLQVASGMSYLESRRFIHCDLAARNILLASDDKVKIGDFGLMRPLPVDEDIYVMGPSGKVPVAWCAPECLKSRQFSHASDVWAFGITVVEMFSYGKQPWEGLDACQILDIVDEPCCGRPSKPNHCPDQMFSLLIEHCWAHKPKNRSKFSCIKESLQQAMPEEVMVLFDLEADENSEKLSSKCGDSITVMAWKCRLGKEFAKGQNKRTRQVGYFPSGQVHRNVLKRTGSRSRPKVVKVKDISPPLDNSFSHCAHRGDGETGDWGTVMSEERQVVGKQHPLKLPSSLIPLNDVEVGSRGPSGQTDADNKLNDACSVNALETSSLASRDSFASNYTGMVPLHARSCADSGYYSNRDTYMSQDYEPMTGSHAIAIPGASNQALCRQMMSQGANIPGTYIPSPLAQRTSGGSPQSDSNFGERRCSGGSSCEGSPVRVLASDSRPPLPAKQGVIGNHGYRAQPENPYENVNSGVPYEYMNGPVRSHGVPVITMNPSSPNSLYVNEGTLCFTNENFGVKNRRTSLDSNHSNGNKSPPCLPPRRKGSRKLEAAGIRLPENGRCWSLPEADLKRLWPQLRIGKKASSFSTVRGLPTPPVSNAVTSRARFQKKMTSAVDSGCWETRTAAEALSDEIYENIDTDIPGGGAHSPMNTTNSATPPVLPKKRWQLQRSFSEPLPDETGGTGAVSGNTRNSCPLDNGLYEQPFYPPQDFDLHPYAEISDLLHIQLRLDDQDNSSEDCARSQLEGVADRETRGEGSGCEDGPQHKDSFKEISKDYADLDTMWAKLREPDGDAEPEPAMNTSPYPPKTKLKACVSDCGINENRASPDQDALWKRNSADQYRIQCYARGQTCSAKSITNSSTSLEVEGVQALHKSVTMVTTV